MPGPGLRAHLCQCIHCPLFCPRKKAKLQSCESQGWRWWGSPATLTRIPQHLRRLPVALLQPCWPAFLPDVSHVFPEFPVPDLGGGLLQESISLHDVKALQLLYRRHCEVTTGGGGGPRAWAPGWGQGRVERRATSHPAPARHVSLPRRQRRQTLRPSGVPG